MGVTDFTLSRLYLSTCIHCGRLIYRYRYEYNIGKFIWFHDDTAYTYCADKGDTGTIAEPTETKASMDEWW